eukprot:gb/GEZN01006140.1/.p1 GENE.gb/GEZN01006140.1/~~gb/GEZN01006140.1/.p1  ORF type:complete len:220 (-),score=41.65 gb/GEZN01006140.1/:794-1453(-)
MVLPDIQGKEMEEWMASQGLKLLPPAPPDFKEVATVTFKDHTYKLYHPPTQQRHAKEFARTQTLGEEPGYLLTLSSPDESASVLALFGDEGLGKSGVWLAGSDEDEENLWVWQEGPEKGEKFFLKYRATKDPASIQHKINPNWYKPWALDEPNNAHGVLEEDCLMLTSRGWNDEKCAGPVAFTIVEFGSSSLPIADDIPPYVRDAPTGIRTEAGDHSEL